MVAGGAIDLRQSRRGRESPAERRSTGVAAGRLHRCATRSLISTSDGRSIYLKRRLLFPLEARHYGSWPIGVGISYSEVLLLGRFAPLFYIGTICSGLTRENSRWQSCVIAQGSSSMRSMLGTPRPSTALSAPYARQNATTATSITAPRSVNSNFKIGRRAERRIPKTFSQGGQSFAHAARKPN